MRVVRFISRKFNWSLSGDQLKIYFLISRRNQIVMKNAAIQTIKFNTMKKPMICQLPELKIGEGGGCITYCALENSKSKMTIYTKLAMDVSQLISSIHKPSCSNTPTTAKVTAKRKRGSARKSPFQLACIAQIESGKYVIQKKMPARPRAVDH